MSKTQEFIQKAIAKHGNKYDYSLVDYIHSKQYVNIICRTHGIFKQIPNDHVSGRGCRYCGGTRANKNNVLGTDEFIKRANNKHDYKYEYDKVVYVNRNTLITITCKTHGDFTQLPSVHINGGNCPECTKLYLSKMYTSNTQNFIEKAKSIHWCEYDYSKVDYINSRTKVVIICPVHGEFTQTPNSHLLGRGCGKCGDISKLEHRFEYYKNTPT